MTDTNPILRPPKSRRLVSAWMLPRNVEPAVERVTQFQDIFDQIIFMCGHVNADGSLPDQWPAEERRELTQRLGEMGVSTLNDYAGGWKGQFEEVAKSPDAMRRLIDNMVAECEETGADGVDIDLEHLPPEAQFPYADLVAGLSQELHQRNKMVSVCTYSPLNAYRRDWGPAFWHPYAVAPYVDHLRPMVYDQFCPPSPQPGPTSTAPWGADCMEALLTQAPPQKIVMGLPTYSVDWDMEDPQKSRQVYDYEWIAEREKESSIGRSWISYWDVGLIRYTDEEGHPHLLYVSDAKSTKGHLVTVDSLDLAGVCFWVLLGDDPAIWEAVREHFRRW